MMGDIVLPGMSRQLSAIELQAARDICRQVQNLVDARDDYVSRNGVDSSFAYPASN